MNNDTKTTDRPSFHQELAALINRYGMEGGSDTPDYILSLVMFRCLEAFNQGVRDRDKHTRSRLSPEEGYRQARDLAVSIQKTDYPDCENWQPLDDIPGVISQIDNMYAGMRDREKYWRMRSLQAEDLIESIQMWHETMKREDIPLEICSRVAQFRRSYRREGVSDFCGELIPVVPDDSWFRLEDKKPTLSDPVVRVRFSNGEVTESAFFVGFFLNDFQRFVETREHHSITHWKPIKPA